MKPFLRNTIFFIGWLLSPLTTWNDAFINIPVAYILAYILTRFIRVDFLAMVLVFYWLSNLAGIFMMYASGRQIFGRGGNIIKEAAVIIIPIIIYSAIIIVLGRLGIIKS